MDSSSGHKSDGKRISMARFEMQSLRQELSSIDLKADKSLLKSGSAREHVSSDCLSSCTNRKGSALQHLRQSIPSVNTRELPSSSTNGRAYRLSSVTKSAESQSESSATSVVDFFRSECKSDVVSSLSGYRTSSTYDEDEEEYGGESEDEDLEEEEDSEAIRAQLSKLSEYLPDLSPDDLQDPYKIVCGAIKKIKHLSELLEKDQSSSQ